MDSIWSRIEPDWFELTTKQIRLPHLTQPVRLLHLSDFHASRDVPFSLIEKAIKQALQQNYDLVCLTGDFITDHLEDPASYRRILRKLSEHAPTVACPGNHDGGQWAGSTYGYNDLKVVQKLLQDSQIRLLINQQVDIRIREQTLSIVGLGDLWSKELHPERVLDSPGSRDQPLVVLAHNPDSKEDLKDYDWDLMLCGHTHGGQLVVPLIDYRPFLPIRDARFAEGLHNWAGRQIHVTRGVGNLHGMRFNCRPEISVLELIPMASPST